MNVSKQDTFAGHLDAVYTLAGLDGDAFVSSGADGRVVLWSLAQPDMGTLLAKVQKPVYAMLIHQGFLFLAENFEGIHQIDLAQKKLVRSLALPQTQVFDMKICGDSLWLAAGKGLIHIVDIANWALKKHIKASEENTRSLTLSGTTMYAGYSDAYIRAFDVEKFSLISEHKKHSLSVFSLASSGGRLFSVARDAKIMVWQLADLAFEQKIDAHLFAINHICFSPNQKLFATASMDKSIKIWQTETLKLLKVVDKARHAGHGTSVNKLLWMSDTTLVSASDDKLISIWNIHES